MPLRDDLEQYAHSIGIDSLRVAGSYPFAKEEALLVQMAASGEYPRLAPQDIPMRCHPRQILPNAHSIISVAVSYLLPDQPTHEVEGPHGSIARFARVGDYHTILAGKLTQLAAHLQEKAGRPIRYRVCVDSGPLVERAVARRAGAGWFGKNSMLFVPRLGSWVVLGEIITDLALPADEPVSQEPCGDCQRCQLACPTGALARPYRVDASRCLSAITQTPGYIPWQFRKLLGRRVWGCDTCQAVCPWNIRAVPGRLSWPPGAEAEVDLIRLLTLSKAQFGRLFGNTAIAWRGRTTLQRNAALALGNLRDPYGVDALASQLDHPSPVVRETCAWALGEINDSRARRALERARQCERAPEVLETILRVMGRGSTAE
ncbi:MAG: tRNA epoxyqueuosine(34) reductase QueG [Limnochordia bacterium]